MDEYFKNKIDRQISYDLISRQDFSYSKNQIDLIINDFEKNINDFIEHGQLKQIIYDERGIMIASIKIQFDEYHQGARISNHDNNPYLYSTIDKYIKTIKNKSLTKLQAFPIDGYNFLLVNIASQHPIWLIYFDLGREKNEIKKFVKKGKLNHPNNNCIDYFEDKIANLIIDEKYSGIILHRYINVYYNNHSFKVFVNPNRLTRSSDLDDIIRELESS